MAGHPSRDQKLFAGGEIRNSFRWVRGISPGPGGKFIDYVVACEDKLLGGDLACAAEGRSV